MPPRDGQEADQRTALRSLAGDLPCVRCRYNLRGLSVVTACPECGTPVRATVLAAIDPLANLLRPIPWPRLIALGLVTWAVGALAAALLTWVVAGAEILHTVARVRLDTRILSYAGLAAIVASGLGALALIRPHAGIPLRQILAAAAGAAAYVPLAALYAEAHGLLGGRAVDQPFVQADAPWPERNLLRLGIAAATLVVVLGLRPNARLLAARSVLLREGRVDRQTMLVMALVVGIGALGDGLHLACAAWPSSFDSLLLTAGLLVIGVSSMLFTVGLGGVLVDAWRIRVVVVQPAPSFTQLVGGPGPGGNGPAGRREDGRTPRADA